MILLHGKLVAERILADTKERIEASGIRPGLAVILAGDDLASHLYVSLKEKAALAVGIHFEKKLFPATVTYQELRECVALLNHQSNIHGIIVQLPLPEGLPTDEIIEHINPIKDTDGFHRETLRQFLLGKQEYCPVFPRAIIELIRETKQVFHGEQGLVIANSELMGKVMAQSLAFEGLESGYVLSTEKREVLLMKTQAAKVIVTARGLSRSLSGEMVQPGVTIIDGGMSSMGGKVVGDVDQVSVAEKADFLSPVPGGVGPVTVATLLARVTDAALNRH